MAWSNDQLVVHEWGTFTALQDDAGEALGGINIDDEPLPEFVHNLRHYATQPPHSLGTLMKGAPQRHPLVRMRLETPVVYFYPPQGARLPMELDLKVRFRGGWLTQFYPQAEVNAPGLQSGRFNFGSLTRDTVGSLAWNRLLVGTGKPGPKTDSRVWTAPREVDAVSVTAESGESEKYLFYRGVGNFEAPLRVISDKGQNTFRVRSQFGEVLRNQQTVPVGPLWLVHVRADGSCAFRTFDRIEAGANPDADLLKAPREFAEDEFSAANLYRLSASMHSGLVSAGLYDVEAAAMLETWRQAYFKSPGLRLFFLVPQMWTNYYLPLEISQPADIRRVMVARIELISPEQRNLLGKLRAMKISDLAWLDQVYRSPNAQRFLEGRSDFGDLGVQIPPEYQTYLDLGRFRNALVIAEERRNPSPQLTQFVEAYGLEQYRWEENERR